MPPLGPACPQPASFFAGGGSQEKGWRPKLPVPPSRRYIHYHSVSPGAPKGGLALLPRPPLLPLGTPPPPSAATMTTSACSTGFFDFTAQAAPGCRVLREDQVVHASKGLLLVARLLVELSRSFRGLIYLRRWSTSVHGGCVKSKILSSCIRPEWAMATVGLPAFMTYLHPASKRHSSAQPCKVLSSRRGNPISFSPSTS